MLGNELVRTVDHIIAKVARRTVDPFLLVDRSELEAIFLRNLLCGMAGETLLLSVSIRGLFEWIIDIGLGVKVLRPFIVDRFVALVTFGGLNRLIPHLQERVVLGSYQAEHAEDQSYNDHDLFYDISLLK